MSIIFSIILPSSAKGSISNSRRHSHSCILAKSALGAAVAMGALAAGQARALVVNVGGQDWNVTTFTGSYNDNISKFATAANGGLMPWSDDLQSAMDFSDAFKAEGILQGLPPSSNSLAFATKIVQDQTAFIVSGIDVNGLCGGATGGFWCSGGPNLYQAYGAVDAANAASNPTLFNWAQASLTTPQSVPGPLPILGAAAAFGCSRKLRKRITSSANAVS